MKIQEKKRTKASILLVYTGGTIGMMQDPNDLTLKPFNFKQILAEAPELGKFAYKIDSYSFNPIIDSSDVEPSLWQKLAWLRNTADMTASSYCTARIQWPIQHRLSALCSGT